MQCSKSNLIKGAIIVAVCGVALAAAYVIFDQKRAEANWASTLEDVG